MPGGQVDHPQGDEMGREEPREQHVAAAAGGPKNTSTIQMDRITTAPLTGLLTAPAR